MDDDVANGVLWSNLGSDIVTKIEEQRFGDGDTGKRARRAVLLMLQVMMNNMVRDHTHMSRCVVITL